MTAQIIDGVKKASEIKAELKKGVGELKERGTQPSLATILVGDDPASQTYVRLKHRACEEVGFVGEDIKFPADTSEEELLEKIGELNGRPDIHGILVQMPLPPHIDLEKVMASIDPQKDVDGFHPINMGKLMLGDESLAPATPKGVVHLLESVTDLAGKDVAIVNRSNVIGKPLALMLIKRSATVTVCHTKTKELDEKIRSADVVVVGVGRPKFLTADMIKEGAIVIDVGITRTDEGIVGDVDFDSVKEKASYITPVPGGVGPMTIAMLLANTVSAAKNLNDG